MSNSFIKYMSNRLKKEALIKEKKSGPVITFSREFGCPSKAIAQLLSDTINKKLRKKHNSTKWKWVSKEILLEVSKELNIELEKIEYVFNYEKKTFFDELISSHSNKYYKSDKKIRNTIGEVIRSIAEQGNVIIVGRGGVAIAKDIPQSLHIKLEAPLEWRTLICSENHNLEFNKAQAYTIEMDKKREVFRDYYYGKDNDYTAFDIKFNCMTLQHEEIVCAIIKIMEERNFI